ncbi:hypothetical protein BTVI_32981 [Pitangus sulphuratus]|nr:hypothetical protein BTVI_32981 [Pitangus sulphuratus]
METQNKLILIFLNIEDHRKVEYFSTQHTKSKSYLQIAKGIKGFPAFKMSLPREMTAVVYEVMEKAELNLFFYVVVIIISSPLLKMRGRWIIPYQLPRPILLYSPCSQQHPQCPGDGVPWKGRADQASYYLCTSGSLCCSGTEDAESVAVCIGLHLCEKTDQEQCLSSDLE